MTKKKFTDLTIGAIWTEAPDALIRWQKLGCTSYRVVITHSGKIATGKMAEPRVIYLSEHWIRNYEVYEVTP